jgi:uncharacterized protein
VALRTDTYDLSRLHLTAGEGRRLDLNVAVDPFTLGGEPYRAEPELVPARIDVSRTTGEGYALRLRLQATLVGACMRCLQPASPVFEVDAREVSQPGDVEELDSPYLDGGLLDVRRWARDALALALPAQILCRVDCAGLCPVCGADLNAAGPDHGHEAGPDPRWAKLSELHFD